MCYLEKTTFSCGHTRKSIFLACNFVSDCTAQKTLADRPFACTAYKSSRVRPSKKHAEPAASSSVTAYNSSVKACLDSAERPIYNFQQIAQEGWNAKVEQRLQDDLWDHILPTLLQKVSALYAHACNEMTTAYVLTINEVSSWHFKRPLINYGPPALETPVNPSWTIVDWLHGDSLVQHWEAAMYEEVYRRTHRNLQHELLELEIQALQACMDDVGWVLPKEESAKHALQDTMVSRLVQPVEKSGTSVRGAFVRRESSCGP
ncbi:hypothetical protein SVAN01_00197 [Stagonosporopsis vannaccii]|nr:hypothetical protein SVAN01_00197 [Stagonosporopsis vannaccii]